MRHLLLALLLVAMTGCGSDTKPEDEPTTPAETASQEDEAAAPEDQAVAPVETFTLQHTDVVNSVSFSPDGTRIASGSGTYRGPGEITVWDASTGKKLQTLKGHGHGVLSVSFSPDGKLIASNSGHSALSLLPSCVSPLFDLPQEKTSR